MALHNESKFELIATGKVRATLNHITFRYELEEQWSDNTYKLIPNLSFSDVASAKAFFERAKIARRAQPADIGNWHD